MLLLVLLTAPTVVLWAQEVNEKFSMTTLMFLNEQKAQAEQAVKGPRRTPPARRLPDGTRLMKPHRLIASPDTVGGVAYISCFIHLKDAGNLNDVRALGVEVEETFDGLDFVTARVPVNQLEPLAGIDNVTKIKVAQQMRPLTDKAREVTNVDDLLTQSNDAIALGITSKYDGTGVILGIIDTGIDFQHIAFKDKDGNSRIKRAYIQTGSSTSSGTVYTEENIGSATTDDSSGDHGTHTASTAGGSSVIVSGSTVTVTDDHANATYGGMAPGADLYLAGIRNLYDTGLSTALQKMVAYAKDQGKPLVVSNSWGSREGPRDGTGELASLVASHFGDGHPNRVILFAASNDAGHRNGNEGGGYFVKKSSASDSSPLGTIIRTDGDGGDYYEGLIACAWNASNSTKLNCRLHVLNSSGTILYSWTVTENNTKIFNGLDTYYTGSMTVYIEEVNGKYHLTVYSEKGLESTSSGAYTLANSEGSNTGFDPATGTLTLYFVDADQIEPGVPYIVKWDKPDGYDGNPSSSDITNPVFSGVTIENEDPADNCVTFTGGKFVGSYSPVAFTANDQSKLFLGSNNKLYWPDANMTVGACRTYFDLGVNQAREFVLNFGDGDTSGITSPKSSPEGKDFSPLLQEGTGEAWYTLDGRKLIGKPTKAGLYIRSTSVRLQGKNNGRKVAIK